VKRREFIALLGGAAAARPLTAWAQKGERLRRIGVLFAISESDPEAKIRTSAIEQGLERLGWSVGRNIQIDYRWAGNEADRLRRYASELMALKPDVGLAAATTPLVALKKEAGSTPIVFVQVYDPVGGGFVASLARPGGNVTGFATFEYGLAAKWLELLRQLAPRTTRVAVVYDAISPSSPALFREVEATAAPLGIAISNYPVRNSGEIERALQGFARQPDGGLIVISGPTTAAHREVLTVLAAQHRLPSVYSYRYFVTSGGLASYGIDNHDLYTRATSYIDRILKGDKAGDLPVQQATKFELVINLKTAKALGLEIPLSLLARTDEVIE